MPQAHVRLYSEQAIWFTPSKFAMNSLRTEARLGNRIINSRLPQGFVFAEGVVLVGDG